MSRLHVPPAVHPPSRTRRRVCCVSALRLLVLLACLAVASRCDETVFAGESLRHDYAADSSGNNGTNASLPSGLSRSAALLASLDDAAPAPPPLGVDDALDAAAEDAVARLGAAPDDAGGAGAGSVGAVAEAAAHAAPVPDEAVLRFVDSHKNHFVLTQTGDELGSMILLEDVALLRDLSLLFVATSVAGCVLSPVLPLSPRLTLLLQLTRAPAGEPSLGWRRARRASPRCWATWQRGRRSARAVLGSSKRRVVPLPIPIPPPLQTFPSNFPQVVQIETVSSLGVLLLLFSLGAELDGAKLRRVGPAVAGGTSLQMALFLGGGAAAAVLVARAPPSAGLLVGAFVLQSSTPLVVSVLSEARAARTPTASLLLALLVAQDCVLGATLGLAGASQPGASGGGAAAAAVATAVAALSCSALVARSGAAAKALRRLAPPPPAGASEEGGASSEAPVLALLALCLGCALAGRASGLSMELGAFCGGACLAGDAPPPPPHQPLSQPPHAISPSSHPHNGGGGDGFDPLHDSFASLSLRPAAVSASLSPPRRPPRAAAASHPLLPPSASAESLSVLHAAPLSRHDGPTHALLPPAEHVQSCSAHHRSAAAPLAPLRAAFGALFVGCVGMTLHPAWLWAHRHVLVAAAAALVATKAATVAASLLACGVPPRVALACGLSLAHAGELGLVLLSRAKGLGLLPRSVFLLLLGAAALSLVAAPSLVGFAARRVAPGGSSRGGGDSRKLGKKGGGVRNSESDNDGAFADAADGRLRLPVHTAGHHGGAGARARRSAAV